VHQSGTFAQEMALFVHKRTAKLQICAGVLVGCTTTKSPHPPAVELWGTPVWAAPHVQDQHFSNQHCGIIWLHIKDIPKLGITHPTEVAGQMWLPSHLLCQWVGSSTTLPLPGHSGVWWLMHH